MLASGVLLLAALLPQDPGEGIRLLQLPSTVRSQEVVRAALRIETSREPETPVLPKVDGLRFALGSPLSSRSISIIGGRQAISSSFTFPLEILPLRTGQFVIPPITVQIGAKRYQTAARTLHVVRNVSGSDFGTLTVTPTKPVVYVHEPIRFRVECAVDSQLELGTQRADNGAQYYTAFVEADWLSDLDGATSIEQKEVDTDRNAYIGLNGRLQPSDVSARRTPDGRGYHVFGFAKSFLPTRAGPRALAAPVLKFSVLTGGRSRDPFEIFARPAQKQYVVVGKPVEFDVRPLPAEGRPEPFYGGVGRFTIDAKLDKHSVKVGGSVKLVVTIAGSGNTEHLQPPELPPVPGLHQLGKIVNREKERVVVTFDLAPRAVEVKALPALQWNFFDTTPGVERYVTVQTAPLPLEVVPLVGEETLAALPGSESKVVEPGVDDIFDVKLGGNPVREPAAPARGPTLLLAALPWLLGLLGLWFVRRRRHALADVAGRRARGAQRSFQQALADGQAPVDALVGYFADRLACERAAVIGPDLRERLAAAGIDEAAARSAQELVDAGVAARYGGGGGLERAAVEALVASLERAPAARASGAALVVLLPLSLGLTAEMAKADLRHADARPAVAHGVPQDGVPQALQAAEKAYRSRDYKAAEAGFRRAADAGDRRAMYNLGNALFRQGRYAEALVAYERARLAMPRDPELLANIKLTRERLELGTAEGEAFGETVAALRDRFTAAERFWMCVLGNALAAGLLCFGGRRLRIAGAVLAVLAAGMLVEVAFLGPARAPQGIIVQPKVALRAEPSAELEALMTVRSGVSVEVLGTGEAWTQVRFRGRKGYVPAGAVAVVD